MNETVIVLDFGGQYKQLIARAVRNLGVHSIILKGSTSIAKIKRIQPIGLILTGGPDSVYAPDAKTCKDKIFKLGIPVLGICYGMHLMCHILGGTVIAGDAGEYGRVKVKRLGSQSALFEGVNQNFVSLMSHRDIVKTLPKGFAVTAKTARNVAAVEWPKKRLYGVQFHPETAHTQFGREILKNFLFNVCKAKGDYKLDDFIETEIQNIRKTVGDKKVLLALSGGVDSSVVAALLAKAVPNQVTCVFVDHGFMRLNEGDEIERTFSKHELKFIRVNAAARYLERLKGVKDPEKKRKIIGKEFTKIFEEEAEKYGSIDYLAQGTIYPDIVESKGIKSHHNVGGLPKNLKFIGLVEPLSGLFKHEVRQIGRKLELPDSLVNRQPFPGPGLAIRITGRLTEEKLNLLRRADAIFREELDGAKYRPDQYFAVLPDTLSVGVKGDSRTYDRVIALRAVNTDDFMTCEYTKLSHKFLSKVASRITSEIEGVSRVVYDITSKPPSTAEWE
jgi:GMP synthase (glutamine-hydrolysing)